MRDKTVTLDCRSDKFTIVLNDNELNLFKNATHIVRTLRSVEKLCVIYIACIKHDRDMDEDKHIKTPHFHVVMHVGGVCRLRTMLNLICDLFKCNENQVTIDKCNSICMQSRYLLHLDDFDKTSYFMSEVVCNDYDTFNRYFNLVIVRDLHDLIAVVKRYNYDLVSIMENVAHYDKWRKYINDLIVDNRRKSFYVVR